MLVFDQILLDGWALLVKRLVQITLYYVGMSLLLITHRCHEEGRMDGGERDQLLLLILRMVLLNLSDRCATCKNGG